MCINNIEAFFSNTLPKSYLDFMLRKDGGSFGDTLLYSFDEILERNECYETKIYAPGWIAIGDNGGGLAVIVPLSEDNPRVFTVEHGIMDPEEAEQVSVSFSAWEASGFTL